MGAPLRRFRQRLFWGAGLALLSLLMLLSCASPESPAGAGGGAASVGEEHRDTPEAELLLWLDPARPAPGDCTVLTAGPCPPQGSIRLETEAGLALSPPHRCGDYVYFIIGIGLEVPPGTQELRLFLEGFAGRREITGELQVAPCDFETSRFSVPVKWTDEEAARRLPEEQERVRRARRGAAPAPLWQQPFIMPLESRISSAYGAVRIINEGAPRRHTGLDIAAARGSPVVAMNAGVVRLAAPLLAQGNTVIIDHGMNLSSSYLHLDSIAVAEGVHVSRGALIGRVGESGFASGPHLHWEVNLGETPLNPLQLISDDPLRRLPGPAVNPARIEALPHL